MNPFDIREIVKCTDKAGWSLTVGHLYIVRGISLTNPYTISIFNDHGVKYSYHISIFKSIVKP